MCPQKWKHTFDMGMLQHVESLNESLQPEMRTDSMVLLPEVLDSCENLMDPSTIV